MHTDHAAVMLETGTRASDPASRRRVLKFHAPEIVFGEHAMVEGAYAVGRLGGHRPLLVTDAGLLAAGWVDELTGHLRTQGMAPHVWSALTPNPKDHEVAAGHRAYREHGCDVLIALGGGSVIDAAKGIAILAANGGNILDYEGIDRADLPIPPLVVLPSTAGSGADVSQFCVVTDTARRTKITIIGRSLVPDVTVIDPRLLTTMPAELAAATGLDALTHGIESFVSLGHNELTDHHALRSVALVTRHLVRTLAEPADMVHRTAMAQAALEAGMAFSNAILGAAHAMSHQVGGMLDLPHGVVNGVLLPHVVRFNAEADPDAFVPVAMAMDLPEQTAPAPEAAEAVARRIERLCVDVGIPGGLAALGVSPDDVPRLAAGALLDACMSTNPRVADAAEIEALFRVAL